MAKVACPRPVCRSLPLLSKNEITLPSLRRSVKEVSTQASISLGKAVHPWGVAISSQGTLFVVDNKKNHIMVFEEGRKQTKKLFGPGSGYMQLGEEKRSSAKMLMSPGSGPNQLAAPCSLVFDSHDNLLYIADSENNRIVVLHEDGSLVATLSHPSLILPLSVAVNEVDKNVYVACQTGVVVLTLEGVLVRRFGSKGDSPGCMIRPSGVAFSRDGDLFVLDHDRVCVMVFTPEGSFLREFANGEFHCPTDILVTADDQVLVADVLNHRVAVFDLHGKLEGNIGVNKPHGLAIDSSGRLYVTDNLAKKCHVLF